MEEYFTRGPWQREEWYGKVLWIGQSNKWVIYFYCAVSLFIINLGMKIKQHFFPPLNAYQFAFTSLQGLPIRLSDYKGQVILVVNTASKCTQFANQYAELQQMYNTYRDRGFVVIGVPSQDFEQLEYISKQAIKKCAEERYGVTFPMACTTRIIRWNAHPFYKWVHSELGTIIKLLPLINAVTADNFHKFLIDKEGNFVDWFSPTVSPLTDTGLQQAVERELDKIPRHFPYNMFFVPEIPKLIKDLF